MKTHKLLCLLLLIIIIGSCNSKKDNSYDNIEQMVSDAQADITKVRVHDLKTILDQKGEYKIIDCRETEEFIEGHIPGALNIPRGVLEFSNKISNRRESIYIYSQTNDRAALACPTLKLLTYKEVFLINGGWEEWVKTFPEIVETGSGTLDGEAPPKKEETSGGCGG